VDANEIAILAPKHQLLEQIVPFLSHHKVPVSYEKREDILQTPLLQAYKLIVSLIIATQNGDAQLMNSLFPQVLSLEFYDIPVRDIWKVNWSFKTGDEDRSWAEIALDNDVLAPHVMFYLYQGLKSTYEPLEYVLDDITGSVSVKIDEDTQYTSPLKEYYFSDRQQNPLKYYELLTNLSTIRELLRSNQQNESHLLELKDFVKLFEAYETAEQPLINTHPITQSEKSVQLMTVYKAKGLEFEYVFMLSVHDDIWGKKARNNSNKLSLPANLQYVRYQGSTEDELKRLLFVAITRAKHGLFLTCHAYKDSGKATEPVKYLLEFTENDIRKTTILPSTKQVLHSTKFSPIETMQHIELLWESRHLQLDAELKSLLKTRLTNYQMSPTHLNTFIDTQYGGPETFLLQTLLRFPQAPGEDGEFGNAVHGSLEWYQKQIKNGSKPTITTLLQEFDSLLNKRYIAVDKVDDFRAKGHHCLKAFVSARKDMFSLDAKTEVDFRQEGVLIGNAHLSGKIDRLEINNTDKTVSIVDFKTGKPHTKWDREVKLIKYKQQLYFYKFLIEGSHTWANYRVAEARLEFVEPGDNGQIVEPLRIDFDESEEKEMKELIKVVWHMIQELELPDITVFSQDYKGAIGFIDSITK
jgi:DNA helicase-2/ATP-dependent DNA helicase PcrA